MHALEAFTGGHRIEQTVGHQRQYMQVEQVVDQACTAVALSAAFSQVIDKVLGVSEIQLTAVQALAQTTEFDFDQLTQHRPPTG